MQTPLARPSRRPSETAAQPYLLSKGHAQASLKWAGTIYYQIALVLTWGLSRLQVEWVSCKVLGVWHGLHIMTKLVLGGSSTMCDSGSLDF
ncbi:hypothetical protein FGO68_gene6307 [Halteria grandinella]|uniref:Uncharacterized protein n=1 Tax=Halteria grandinella TaxID=5974 RepID=A0A8J8NQX1_HALGN|nr:hypothetical protein FGO68_gene6307 [Halteria grandinella]